MRAKLTPSFKLVRFGPSLDRRKEKSGIYAGICFVDIREIKDAAKMDEYRSHVAPTVEKFGGRYLVRGGPFEVVEGTYQPVRLAMLEFPSMEQARRWYDSEDYRELKQPRLAATVSNGFFMNGA